MRTPDIKAFGPWAVVTGASSGIGKELARQLAASGVNVALVARRKELLEEQGRSLREAFKVDYLAVEADLSTEGFVDRIEEATSDIEVGLLASNAGAIAHGRFLEGDPREIRRMLRLNVLAHVELAHAFGRRFAARGRGGLLITSSMAGLQGTPYMADYSAAKSYLLALGEALHVEWAPRGIAVTVLVPGPTDTPMLAASGTEPQDTPMKPMSAARCAAEGLEALCNHRAVHVPGAGNRLLIRLIPRAVRPRMMGAMVAKGFERQKALREVPNAEG